MDKLKNNLTGIVSLIGVIGAIGAGFTTYGQLITTISVLEEKIVELESKEYVVNETVDLTDINNKINDNYESVLDRISGVQKDISMAVDSTLDRIGLVQTDVNKVSDDIYDKIGLVQTDVNKNTNNIEVLKTKNELFEKQIEEVQISSTNPLSR